MPHNVVSGGCSGTEFCMAVNGENAGNAAASDRREPRIFLQVVQWENCLRAEVNDVHLKARR